MEEAVPRWEMGAPCRCTDAGVRLVMFGIFLRLRNRGKGLPLRISDAKRYIPHRGLQY
jgi:hypothetical protein